MSFCSRLLLIGFLYGFASLTVPTTANGSLKILEILAINSSGIQDEEGSREDWIEISNQSDLPVDLGDFALTDDLSHADLWTFPSRILEGGESLLVFASGKDRAEAGGILHTDFSLDGDGEYLALLAHDGTNVSQSISFPKQYTDISYGEGPGGEWYYLLAPTPGEENASPALSVLEPPVASVDRGLYRTPFALILSNPDPEAIIHYTVDGATPTADSPQYEEPLQIDGTSVIRAIAVRPNHLSSVTATWTYLFPDDIQHQAVMDPRVTKDPGLSVSIASSIESLPILSLVLNEESFFGPEGIYSDPQERGVEVAVSMEWLNSSDRTPFQVNAGLRIHGGDARLHPKKPLRLHFRADYGTRWLDQPLIPDTPVSRFRDLVLRGGGHDAWSEPRGEGGGNSHAFHATYLRDAFVRRNDRQMGLIPPEGEFCHLFINGIYWGLYQLQERPSAAQMAERLGGEEEEWDVLKSSEVIQGGVQIAEVADGDRVAWDLLQSELDYDSVQEYLDLDAFSDSLISRMWAGDHDWLGPVFFQNFSTPSQSRNWYAVRRSRGVEGSPFHFFTWDAEISVGSNLFAFINPKRTLTLDLTRIDVSDSPAAPYDTLRHHPRFQALFADRLRRHLSPDGALSSVALQSRWRGLANRIESALTAESARWGDVHEAHEPFGPHHPWRSEVDWVHDVFLVQRGAIFLEQCRKLKLYPSIESPQFIPSHGTISSTEAIEITSIEGATVWYTLDGSDPKSAVAGEPFENATMYQNRISSSEVTPLELNARARTDEGVWSALTRATFHLNSRPVQKGDLQLVQLLPNPFDPTSSEIAAGFDDPSDFEFIECWNGSSATLQMQGCRFTNGVSFSFDRQLIAPAEHFIIARNPLAFTLRFGPVDLPVLGPYAGRLDNSGERLRLETAMGETLLEFVYGTSSPWPSGTREGHSLLFSLRTNLSPSDPGAWQASDSPLELPIGVQPGDTFGEWQTQHFDDPASPDALADADPDEDGFPNAIEYLLGSNPQQRSPGDALEVSPVTVVIGSMPTTYLQIVLHTRAEADRFPLSIEESQDLQNWRTADLSLIQNEGLSDGRNRRTYRSRFPIGADALHRGHWRLKVMIE